MTNIAKNDHLIITTTMIVIGKMNSPISLYIASIGILIIWIVAKTSKLLKAKILS